MNFKKISLLALCVTTVNLYSSNEKASAIAINDGEELEQFYNLPSAERTLGTTAVRLIQPFKGHATGRLVRGVLTPRFLSRININENINSGRLPHRVAHYCCNAYDGIEEFTKKRPLFAAGIGAFLGLSALYGFCLSKGYTNVPGVTRLMNFGDTLVLKYASLGNLFAKKAVENSVDVDSMLVSFVRNSM